MQIALILLLTIFMNVQKPVGEINNYIFTSQNIKVYNSNVSENLKNCDILLESHK